MTFVDERELAERALAGLRRDSRLPFPPVAQRIRAARQHLGISQIEVARRWGVEPTLYWGLELRDEELFTCVDVGKLAALAAALELPLMVLLFGEEPSTRPAELEYSDVAERIKWRLSKEGITVHALSESVGWELERVLQDPATLAAFNIVGVWSVRSS
jgi:transcriptional regulator with XRE-family HTH domain